MFGNKNKYIFITAFVVVVAYLTFNFFITVPSFSSLLITNIEDEAKKIASHLSSQVVSENNTLMGQEDLAGMPVIDKVIADFNLEKIKIFSESGLIIYSSNQADIGAMNTKEYFHAIIAQGIPYTKVVHKDSMTMEGRKVSRDVLETYVPIMIDGKFIGAFEIYFDITSHRQRLDNAVLKSSLGPLFLMFVFLMMVIFFLKTDKSASQAMPTGLATRYSSPLFFFFVSALAIFLADSVLMLFLSRWQPSSIMTESLFDASALIMLVIPVLYYALVMPLTSHIAIRHKIEGELRKAHEELEMRVEQRTAELKAANVTLKKEISQRLQYQEEIQLSDSVLESTIEGITITDADGVIQRVNSSFSQITGYAAAEVIGQNPRILKSEHHEAGFYEKMWESIIQTGRWKGEIWNRRKNGEVYPEWLSITAITDETGKTTHYVAVFHDISELKRAEDKLSHQAFHDALTGLPNRQLFYDRLEAALLHAQRHHSAMGLLFLDLDNFKKVNDSLGHNFGDIFLQEVAKRLTAVCRKEDTISRLGGDEFTVILPNIVNADGAVASARRISQALEQPIDLMEQSIPISASIGITLYPGDGENVEELIKNADLAMYSAKKSGKNNFHLFTEELNIRVNRRITLENNLRKALELQEFLVHYQPKVDLTTGRIHAVEALVRWCQADGTVISPGEFIPVAEDSGLIVPIGEFVLESACNETKKWHDAGYPIGVSVNLSIRQFRQENLVHMVKNILQKSGLPAKALELEITESLLLENEESSIEILHKLKKEGISFAIDDFGTGYSSLSYLKQMPIDVLKIDRAFIKDIPEDRDDIAITAAIISIADSLGLETVAEGAETIEQVSFLRREGCSQMQGFYFSPPVTAETLTRFLAEDKKLEF